MKLHTLFLAIICGLSLNLQAQKKKVKDPKISEKDYIISVNDTIEYLKLEKPNPNVSIFKNLDGEELGVMKYQSYSKPNPAYLNTNDPNRHKYPATTTVSYVVVTFLDPSFTFESNSTFKRMYSLFYKYKVIENGKVNIENAQKLAQLHGENISGNAPNTTVIIAR